MNAKEINPGSNGTIPLFVALAAPLTIVTIWIFIAFRSQYHLRGKSLSFVQRLAWPVLLLRNWYKKDDKDKDKRRRPIDRTMRDDYKEEMEEMVPNDSWV